MSLSACALGLFTYSISGPRASTMYGERRALRALSFSGEEGAGAGARDAGRDDRGEMLNISGDGGDGEADAGARASRPTGLMPVARFFLKTSVSTSSCICGVSGLGGVRDAIRAQPRRRARSLRLFS